MLLPDARNNGGSYLSATGNNQYGLVIPEGLWDVHLSCHMIVGADDLASIQFEASLDDALDEIADVSRFNDGLGRTIDFYPTMFGPESAYVNYSAHLLVPLGSRMNFDMFLLRNGTGGHVITIEEMKFTLTQVNMSDYQKTLFAPTMDASAARLMRMESIVFGGHGKCEAKGHPTVSHPYTPSCVYRDQVLLTGIPKPDSKSSESKEEKKMMLAEVDEPDSPPIVLEKPIVPLSIATSSSSSSVPSILKKRVEIRADR